MSCLFASAVAVYPEAAMSSSASRTTEMPRASTSSADTPLITEEMVNGWVARWQQRLGDGRLEDRD